ncbi:MAG: hypothetical protein QXW47_07235 [Candidatus Jordarchaeales archaeon]|nr:hypothetical protein [Candidatus Jordarchaeia archaeon]
MWFEGKGRTAVWCSLVKLGDGLVFCIGGGDETHIGAVSVAVPYKQKDNEWSVSTSTITLPYHRDDVLTRIMTEKVAKATGKVVVAVGGVHLEGAARNEIDEVVRNMEKLAERVAAELRTSVATDTVK